jgi:sterol desaturase/sphingolipid hydroxylase (fatty acid hydroxylase superfamily)
MNLELIVTLAVPLTFIGFAVLERLMPARPLPKISWWRSKGVFFFVLTSLIGMLAPLLWAETIQAYRIMDLEWLGAIGGGLLAFAGYQLAQYWWHRAMHNTDFLWRWFHQMHHSAERHDIFGAAYFHPFDVVGFAFVQTSVPLMIGVSLEAALLAGYLGAFYAYFQHTNVRTPRWLGYFIERPESHSVHHGRGVHRYNYADLPLWDLVFGTFVNPERFETETGFYDGASKLVVPMLLGRDVNAEEAEAELATRA